MASGGIEGVLNDEVGMQDLKTVSNGHKIVREQYFRERFGIKE
jgi:hypothetical protein